MTTTAKQLWALCLLAAALIVIGMMARSCHPLPAPNPGVQYASETTVQPNPETTQPDLTPKPLPKTGGVPIP